MAIVLPWHSNPSWQPTQFRRFEKAMGTSMRTARIVTDAGHAYIKAMGPHESPQLLAVEFVATRLAQWFRLPVLDFGIIEIDSEIDEIPLDGNTIAQSGPAFVTRAIDAHQWGGSVGELDALVNAHDIGRLVVFDTWVRNCDRFSGSLTRPRVNYDNVLLEHLTDADAGKLRLIAMDHTHCFTCGRELERTLNHIQTVQDDALFGLFPGFIPLVRQEDVEAATHDLLTLDTEFVGSLTAEIPGEWLVTENVRQAWAELICRRADYVARNVLRVIAARCWPDKLFDC